MAEGDFKDLNRRTLADKLLRVKAFNIVKDPKVDGYQRGFASMVYKVFDKKLLVVVLKVKIFLIKNYQKNYTDQLLENLIKRSTFTFYRQYLGRRFNRYRIDK